MVGFQIKEAIAESVRESATGRTASAQSSSAAGSAKAGSPEEEPPILAAVSAHTCPLPGSLVDPATC